MAGKASKKIISEPGSQKYGATIYVMKFNEIFSHDSLTSVMHVKWNEAIRLFTQIVTTYQCGWRDSGLEDTALIQQCLNIDIFRLHIGSVCVTDCLQCTSFGWVAVSRGLEWEGVVKIPLPVELNNVLDFRYESI